MLECIEDFEETMKMDEEDMIHIYGRQDVWKRVMVFGDKIRRLTEI